MASWMPNHMSNFTETRDMIRTISNHGMAGEPRNQKELEKTLNGNRPIQSPQTPSPLPALPPGYPPQNTQKNRGGKISHKLKGPFPSGRRQLHRNMKLILPEQCL